jgi:hypothetical protein
LAFGGSGTVTNTGGALTANAVVLGNGGSDTKVSTGITTNGGSELDVGVSGTSGVIGWNGSTSGKVTCTAPAVAGTTTNPLVCSNAIQLPVGAPSTPAIPFTGHLSSGFYYNSGHGPAIGDASISVFCADSNQGAVICDGNSLLFSPNNDGSGAKLSIAAATPTISSGFGTSPSVTAGYTTASFRINVGTGGTATSGVIGMATATTGWNCPGGFNLTAHAGNRADDTVMTASTTNTVTFQNQTKSTGAAVAWTASDVLAPTCFPN